MYRKIPLPVDILERIRQRAAAKLQHIVLPEGNDRHNLVGTLLDTTVDQTLAVYSRVAQLGSRPTTAPFSPASSKERLAI